MAYVFAHPRAASYKLGQMILPQLEAGTHGVKVVGVFFFDDNVYILRQGDAVGERLAEAKGILLMMCDMCALERGLATGQPLTGGRVPLFEGFEQLTTGRRITPLCWMD